MHPIAQWAKNLNINGFTDWYIPSKDELNQIYKNTPKLFENRWYWSSTQYAANTAYAWGQSFGLGGQYDTSKNLSYYARAVRRLAFNHSAFHIYDKVDGGLYAGKYTLDGIDYALIVAPKKQGETVVKWKAEKSATEGTYSETDGLANTLAMLKADGIEVVPPPQYDPKDVAFQSVGIKHDDNKPRFDLIPPQAELELARVLEYGARKYAPNNWKHVPDAKARYIAATMRHLNAYRTGEVSDPETGLHHLAHAMASLSFIVELELNENTPSRTRTDKPKSEGA